MQGRHRQHIAGEGEPKCAEKKNHEASIEGYQALRKVRYRSPVVVQKSTAAVENLVPRSSTEQNLTMRALAGLLAAVALAFGVYYFHLRQMPSTDAGTAPTQAISLTAVRSDLLQIAQAERSNIALNSKCDSLDELISSGALTIGRRERDGYSYQVSCSGMDFQVIAEHPGPPAAAGVRYPKLAIDASMQIQEVR